MIQICHMWESQLQALFLGCFDWDVFRSFTQSLNKILTCF